MLVKALPGNVDPEVINKVMIPKIIQKRYPDLTDDELEEVRQYVVVDSAIKNGEIKESGDKQFIRMAILGFIEEVKKNKRFRSKKNLNIEKYDDDIINNLKSFLGQIIQFRKYGGYERELEIVIKDVLETLKLKYAQNVKSYDKGIDFAI